MFQETFHSFLEVVFYFTFEGVLFVSHDFKKYLGGLVQYFCYNLNHPQEGPALETRLSKRHVSSPRWKKLGASFYVIYT